ncbi:MAG TPA: hypothetical protein EYQ31_08285 [Candidatus Handelsmanbacteria bacterium]|nr:hypothetical protein [Candidatus Handelsmanbacteria bacterium]
MGKSSSEIPTTESVIEISTRSDTVRVAAVILPLSVTNPCINVFRSSRGCRTGTADTEGPHLVQDHGSDAAQVVGAAHVHRLVTHPFQQSVPC